MIKDCGFYTFSQFKNNNNVGSSRLRAEWLCNYWPEAELFVLGQKYKTVVFQKAYWLEYANLFSGLKILDICDAEDKDWKAGAKKMIKLCDGIITSTEAIAKLVRRLTTKPVLCIPDRLDFNYFSEGKKEHKGDAKIAAWYGYSNNFPMLAWAIPDLIKNKIEKLIVISNSKYSFCLPKNYVGQIEVINFPWDLKTVNHNLLLADLVINPHLNRGKWKYKSNNKTVSAWALGLPVAQTVAELENLINEEARKKEAAKRYWEVRRDYNVRQSVIELKNFIELIKNKTEKDAFNKAIQKFRRNDYLPDWSKNKKELRKYYINSNRERRRLYIATSKKSLVLYRDSLMGKIGLTIKKISPSLYYLLKNLNGPSLKRTK